MTKKIILIIEALNDFVGRTVSWLVVLMVVTTCLVAVLRYVFNIGSVALQESYVWMHGIVFMTASGYTMLHNGHVRVDIVYGYLSPRGKAYVNILGVLFLLFPMLLVISVPSFPYIALSWARLETSPDAGGLPGLFILKTSILAFATLLALQGVALVLRCILVLQGDHDWDPAQATEGQAH